MTGSKATEKPVLTNKSKTKINKKKVNKTAQFYELISIILPLLYLYSKLLEDLPIYFT